MTEYEYNADGLVTSVTRKDGAETLASVSVAYDESARLVSVRDQDGRVTAFDRDEFGRVLKEKIADGSEVAYTYDAFGRRTSVLDENGHRISFDWNRFGLSRRTTAANQLTDYVRDDDGLVTEILSKQGGRTDRSIRNSYDEYGRLECVDYGPKESEKFTYDKWGRIASHSRGDLKTTYTYDHFGRLASQKENGCDTTYTYDRYGSRTSRITSNRKGEIVSKENRVYDRYGRLSETIAGFGSTVKYAYDAKGRLSSQTINGELIEYAYTRRGQLAGKYLGGKLKPDAAVEYEYAKNGQITARTANGVRQTYEYDFKGQLLGVKEGEEYVERYVYDRAGNMTKKTVGGKTTTFTFDDANQLVSSTSDGITTRYEYDAAGRMIKEGDKTYTYGYLDKVLSVTEGDKTFNYAYHPDGQLASANYGDSSESFTWDGLALIQRGNEHFINEPHVGGGNPVVSSKGTSYFNDMLGTTVGAKSGKTYSAATLSAFGEDLTVNAAGDSSHSPFPVPHSPFFTGKPHVAGLGHAFLMRNYRAGLGKWQTADPLGYPDGWNALAYCNNGVTSAVDLWGCVRWTQEQQSAIDSMLETLTSGKPYPLWATLVAETKMTGDAISGKNNGYEFKKNGYAIEWYNDWYDCGEQYWEGGHLWQPIQRDGALIEYAAKLRYLICEVNLAIRVTLGVAGIVGAVVTIGSFLSGVGESTVLIGSGGTAVTLGCFSAVTSLMSICGAIIYDELYVPVGFEFVELNRTNDWREFDRRMIE